MKGEDPLDRKEGGTQKVACGVHTEGHSEVSVRGGGGARAGQKFCLGRTGIFTSAWRINSTKHIMT